MIAPKIPQTKINEYNLRISSGKKGTNNSINQARLDKEFAVESTNLWQVQDGIWKTRPGTKYYGQVIEGVDSIDGAVEYQNDSGERLIIAIAGGSAYISSDGGSWSNISGATFTEGEKPFFMQINSKMFIANGVDPLTYYDGSSLLTYSGISAPTGQSASATGIAGSGFSNYYRIVAVNEIGFTTPSNVATVNSTKHRDSWATDASEYTTITWSSVTGANAYQVYWGEFDGEEVLIGQTTGVSFVDYGEATNPKNIYVETPDDNTTAAPKFRVMEISGNRLWATYDPNHPWRIYFTGVGQYFVNPAFSPFYGGGYIDLEIGTKNKPVSVVHYRSGKGDPTITALCSSPDGQGTIFQIDLATITVGSGEASTTITVPAASKIVGSIGADSPYGVVKVGDNVFFANKKGVYALRNKAQVFNVLSTDDLTSNIRQGFDSINQSKLTDICAYHRPPRVFFSVATSSENDKTIIYDTERRNWTWAWSIGFKQFFEYTDNSNTKSTKFLAVPTSGNRLVEISENYTGDFGEGFLQTFISPLIRISDDYTTQAKIKEAICELGNFRGTLTFSIIGLDRNGQVTTTSTKTITATTGTTGIGDDFFSDLLFSDTANTPSLFAESSTKKKLRVGKKLYAIQFKVTSKNVDTSFELLGFQAKGYLMPARAPSQWN